MRLSTSGIFAGQALAAANVLAVDPRTETHAKHVIFTGVDGTLLHPRTHDSSPALPGLDLARRRTGKTRPEVDCQRRETAGEIALPLVAALAAAAKEAGCPVNGLRLQSADEIRRIVPYFRATRAAGPRG